MVGRDCDVCLRRSEKPEFDAWRWHDYWVPLDCVIEFKRDVYQQALIELSRFVFRTRRPSRHDRSTTAGGSAGHGDRRALTASRLQHAPGCRGGSARPRRRSPASPRSPTTAAAGCVARRRGVVDQPARDLAAADVDAAHHFAALEFALHLRDADRQQALALSLQRARRAGIEHQPAAHLQMVRQPLLARGERHRARRASWCRCSRRAASRSSTSGSRPEAMTVWAPLRAARLAASTLVSMPPRPMRCPRRPPSLRAPDRRPVPRVTRSRSGSLRGSRVEEARLVGEDHQRVGFDQIGDQRAERVVVAEPDLVDRDGVVLVDDRDHAQSSSSVRSVERALR